MKWEFINDQLIIDTINAAFQRANIYQDRRSVSDPNRIKLRSELKNRLIQLSKKYKSEVTEDEHCQNIENLAAELTKMFGSRGLLKEKRFRIGIAQKALNLYLKYLWCLDKIEMPPHCPFDNVVIEKLRNFFPKEKKINWTEMNSIDEYKELVQASKKLIDITEYQTIAEWELAIWQEHLNSL